MATPNLNYKLIKMPASVVQSVTCLISETCLNADPGVLILIPAHYHTFVEIDHDRISTAILVPSADSRRDVVSYKSSQACPGNKCG